MLNVDKIADRNSPVEEKPSLSSKEHLVAGREKGDDLSPSSECNPTQERQISGNGDVIAEVMKKGLFAQDRMAILRRDIRALDSMIAKMSVERNLAAEIFMASEIEQDEEIKLHSHARELITLAKAQIKRRRNYITLFGLLFFFGLYCTAILLQREGSAAYDVESRCALILLNILVELQDSRLFLVNSVILSNIMGSLPTISATSFFNGGGPGSTGQLKTNADFYMWLNESVISLMFKDAICGDGICSSPEEVPGVGRFGWYSSPHLFRYPPGNHAPPNC